MNKWANNAIKHDTMSDLFPKHEKNHPMVTRNKQKYEIKHANTNRLKSSSIYTMRKLLNKEFEEEN